MRVTARKAALRIARRDAVRTPARSLLVVAMIALPVLALTSADVLARTAQLSPAEKVARQLGPADASLTWRAGKVTQTPDASQEGSQSSLAPGPAPKPPTDADVLRVLPLGTRVVSKRTAQAAYGTKDGVQVADLSGFDYTAAPVRGLIRQVSGRAPRTGDEIALSPPLARALRAGIGDSVTTTRPAKHTFRVVGLAQDPTELNADQGYTLPSGLPALGVPSSTFGDPGLQWYASTPQPVDWKQVLALNDKGYVVRSRVVLLDPPPRSQVPYYQDQPSNPPVLGVSGIAIIVLVAGMALLEVVLLAGPAFAVGARRRRRELALVTATGGEPRDVGNIVLAGGVVLGLAGGIVGIAIGIGLAAALLPTLQRVNGAVAGHFDIRPLELAAVALLGLLTGVAAAYLPARSAARQDVIAALAGRRGAVRSRRWMPLIGLVLSATGAAVAIGGAAYLRSIPAVLIGAILGEIGLITCTPLLLGLAGRLGRRLPLSPRMALRDAARNRSSATPAVAAIMAAVAGSVAIGIVGSTQSALDRRAYQPAVAVGDALVQLQSAQAAAAAPQIAEALRSTLPTEHVTVVRGQACRSDGGECLNINAVFPPEQACPGDVVGAPVVAGRLLDDPRCAHPVLTSGYVGQVIVSDGADLPALVDRPAAAGVAALRAGKAVVFDSRLVKDGQVTFEVESPDLQKPKSYTFPAVALEGAFPITQAVLPDALATRLGMHVVPIAVYAHDRTMPSAGQGQAAQAEIDRISGDVSLLIERGYVDRYSIPLLALVIGAGIITLGASVIATALSNVDSRPDLVTLAAVGASPRVRRMLSMSRAGVIAGLGTALGAVAGFVPSIGLILVQRALDSPLAPRHTLAVPWRNIGLTAVVVPILAICIAGLFSRSRLPVERRPAT